MRLRHILLLLFPSLLSINVCQAQKLYGAATHSNFGFIDSVGNWIIKEKYTTVDVFSEGLARFEKGLLWGYINEKGEEVIPAKFTKSKNFVNGLAQVKQGTRYGIINKRENGLFNRTTLMLRFTRTELQEPRKAIGAFLMKKVSGKYNLLLMDLKIIAKVLRRPNRISTGVI